MKNIKIVYKKAIDYIATRKILKYSLIIIILLIPTGNILTNKYINSKQNEAQKIAEEEKTLKQTTNENITKGSIDTNVTSNNMSKHTLSDGFSTLNDDDISNSSSNNTNRPNIQNTTQNNIDKSSISGIDLEILEGYEFNPKRDLKLKATDNDGSDISDSIIIDKNTVNNIIPGIYSVKASVGLSNGQTKQKEFIVTVKETRLDVSLQAFKPLKTNIQKGENIGFEFDFKVSKKHIQPIEVMINGKKYPLYKGNDNIIDLLNNTKNYKVFIPNNNNSGIYEYNLEHVRMSNGAWISLGQNIQQIEVQKEQGTIENFNYNEISSEKKIQVKFDLKDLDNSISNLKLEFSKDNKIVKNIKLNKSENYSIDLPVTSNGIYSLKILSDVNLNQDIVNNNTIINKEIFSTIININTINQTDITGNDIEIIEGETFNYIEDLGLKAIDFDGEDITDKIKIEGDNIDIHTEGKQSIKVSVVNKYGEKYTKEFYVTVNPYIKNQSIISKALLKNIKNDKNINEYSKSKSTIKGNDNETLSHSVQVEGTVTKSDGTGPVGKIIVELPTTMSFAVDNDGTIYSGAYEVSNKGSGQISIYVDSFIDKNPIGGIDVKPSYVDISNMDRSNIHLFLQGNLGNKVDLANIQKDKNEILRVNPLETCTMQLTGIAGKNKNEIIDKEGTSDKFSLIFKIKKV